MKRTDQEYPPIIVIAGTTASGKSSLAIELAHKFNGIVVNADSKQVYKEINIGTAKPIPDEIKEDHWLIDGIRHYLFGYVPISEKFDLYKYQRDCLDTLSKIDRNTPVFLVGGTGLYINAVIYNYQLDSNNKTSERQILSKYSISELQSLIGKNISELNNSDKNNKVRLIRLIERNGRNVQKGKELDHIVLLVEKDSQILEQNIEKRVDEMFKQGLLEEATRFRQEILAKEPNFNIIGYQEFYEYFNNMLPLESIKALIIQNTKRYAKRQRTWFRNKTKCEKIANYQEALPHITNFLTSSM